MRRRNVNIALSNAAMLEPHDKDRDAQAQGKAGMEELQSTKRISDRSMSKCGACRSKKVKVSFRASHEASQIC